MAKPLSALADSVCIPCGAQIFTGTSVEDYPYARQVLGPTPHIEQIRGLVGTDPGQHSQGFSTAEDVFPAPPMKTGTKIRNVSRGRCLGARGTRLLTNVRFCLSSD